MMSQSIVASKSAKSYQAVQGLLDSVDTAVEERMPLHKLEKEILQQVLEIGGHAVQMVFDKLGQGDLGAQLRLPDGRTLKRSEERKQREYVPPFGAFSVARYAYAQRERQKAELIPVDAHLALPESKFSYLLQDFGQHLAMEEPFAKVAGSIERIRDNWFILAGMSTMPPPITPEAGQRSPNSFGEAKKAHNLPLQCFQLSRRVIACSSC